MIYRLSYKSSEIENLFDDIVDDDAVVVINLMIVNNFYQ